MTLPVRHVVLGDIGGQLAVFEEVLEALGVDAAYRLPEGVRVTQVGDLVRLYPQFREANRELVRLVEKLCGANPLSWVQLIGNHECPVLGGPSCAGWDVEGSCPVESREALRASWSAGRLQIADVVDLVGGPALVTHGGLTRGYWKQLGRPGSAALASELLNLNLRVPLELFSQPGYMVSRVVSPAVDPLWPEIYDELYAPWARAGDMPFNQFHGHCSAYDWDGQSWRREAPAWARESVRLLPAVRNSRFPVGRFGRFLHTVDWQLGNRPRSGLWPLFQVEDGVVGYDGVACPPAGAA